MGYLAVACLATWLALGASGRQASAQPPGVTPEQIKEFQELQRRDPAKAQQMLEQFMTPRGGGGPPGGEQPKPDDKPKDDKPKEEGGDKPSAGDAETVKRPDKPDEEANPDELKAAPDKDGLVQFSFQGQPWRDVLQWYADVAGLSFDWTELPGGYLNLTTTRKYTLDETSNLLNQHLLARGFTMIQRGEVLSAVKIDKLDPSLVPQVDPDELEDYPPYDFVRVRFSLPENMDPEKAKEDVKILLSPNSKVVPLLASKRLLVIDAVVNLRDVRDLLYSEQLAIKSDVRPQPFMIRYQRADWIADQVMIVLGLDPASQPSQMELQVQMQKMQLMQQLQKSGKDVSRMLNRDGPKVYLAFNKQENSILANAPAEQLKIIERTINYLDIPPPGSRQSEAPGDFGQRVARTYELENVSPDSLQVTLKEIGDLHPLTELRADSQAKILFVRATEADQAKVKQIIDELDQGRLEFDVFQLRRHAADAVKGTVMELLSAEEKKDNNDDYYGWYYPRRNEPKKEEPKLRVGADIDSNRLLVYGTHEQIEQVRSLLKKLGEIGGSKSPGEPSMRVYEPLDPEDSRQLIERLRAAWPALGGGSEMILDAPGAKPADEEEAVPEDRSASLVAPPRFHLLADTRPADAEEEQQAETEGEKPKIAVTLTPDGRIVLMSEDPAAVARAEELLDSLSPREEQFHEFKIKHTDAYYIWYDLKDYFEEELKGDGKEVVRDWYGRIREFGKDTPALSLSQRRQMRFLYIVQTNSVIVANATPQQLDTIEKLIDIWDQPPRESDVRNRRTGMVKVNYSSPTKIATALKEVYRDLLSSRDKEFQTEENKSGSGYTTAKTTQVEFAGVDQSDGPVTTTKPIKVRFDGALSIGVDEVSGMLLISATTEIYDGVVRMIHLLDEEARPNNTIAVHRVNSGNVESVKQALAATAGAVWVGGKP
ncbi:MAG: hypothetical protein KDA37_10940, partial [Planctomycetales bacterium]|nr:hypothetical protein [Planctomycetales bacterium]